jgi:hypothetical protein
MDKEIYTIGIALLMVALFFLPVIYFEIRNRRSSNSFINRFRELAQKNHVSLTQFDSWRDRYAIGLDQYHSKIFYLNKNEAVEESLLIDLHELHQCRIVKNETKTGSPNSPVLAIRQIDLALTFQNPKKPVKIMAFFSDKSGDSLKDELRMAEKWSGIINSGARNLKKPDSNPVKKPSRPVAAGTR